MRGGGALRREKGPVDLFQPRTPAHTCAGRVWMQQTIWATAIARNPLTWPGIKAQSAAVFAIGFAIGSRNQWHGPTSGTYAAPLGPRFPFASPREGALCRLRLELASGGLHHKARRTTVKRPPEEGRGPVVGLLGEWRVGCVIHAPIIQARTREEGARLPAPYGALP